MHPQTASQEHKFIYIQEAKYIIVIYQCRNDISDIQEEYSQVRSTKFKSCVLLWTHQENIKTT